MAAVVVALTGWVDNRARFLTGGTAVIALVFLSLMSIEAALDRKFATPMMSIRNGGDLTTTLRLDHYLIALRSVAGHPVFGFGFGIALYVADPHSVFHAYFMATRLFGGLLALLALRATWLVRPRGVSIGFALCNTQSLVGMHPSVLWPPLWRI